MKAAASPLNIFPLERDTTRVIAMVHNPKYSQGPRFTAALAISGQKNTAMTVLKNVPRKEPRTPAPNALVVCPFWLRGYASKQVAMEDGVPGIPTRVAAINPPDIPPT